MPFLCVRFELVSLQTTFEFRRKIKWKWFFAFVFGFVFIQKNLMKSVIFGRICKCVSFFGCRCCFCRIKEREKNTMKTKSRHSVHLVAHICIITSSSAQLSRSNSVSISDAASPTKFATHSFLLSLRRFLLLLLNEHHHHLRHFFFFAHFVCLKNTFTSLLLYKFWPLFCIDLMPYMHPYKQTETIKSCTQ